MSKILTVSMPSWQRPQRTIRAINCIANQTMNNWEALIVGDSCPVIQNFIDTNYFSDLVEECKSKGNDLLISNNQEHKGNCGYFVQNQNIQNAKSKYYVFYANDDIILPNHFENYVSQIEGTDYDFVYNDSYIKFRNWLRSPILQKDRIGHAELIVKTEFLKKAPPHTHEYGHDWWVILWMIENGKGKKGNGPPTYHITGWQGNKEEEID